MMHHRRPRHRDDNTRGGSHKWTISPVPSPELFADPPGRLQEFLLISPPLSTIAGAVTSRLVSRARCGLPSPQTMVPALGALRDCRAGPPRSRLCFAPSPPYPRGD